MRLITRIVTFVGVLAASAAGARAAQPVEWQVWFQPASTDIMHRIVSFGTLTFLIIAVITVFVMALLLYVMIKFSAKANPEPSRTTHNSLVEVAWTVIPIIILIVIAVPSFDLLDRQLNPPKEPELTVKAVGYQWYWGYEYQDEGELSFDSIMLRDDSERQESGKTDLGKYPRLLAVDNELVVPVDTIVRVLVTAEDVIHSFAVPSFGVKIDAVPLRMNETWFAVEREGLYYGQCSELCGKDHSFMPIAVRAVSKADYAAWRSAAAENLGAANQALVAAIENRNSEISVASK